MLFYHEREKYSSICRIKIIVVGNSNVGKSSLIKRIVDNAFSEEKPVNPPRNFFNTYEMEYEGKKYQFEIAEFVDTNQEISGYGMEFKNARIVIGLFDLTNLESMTQIEKWIQLRSSLSDDKTPYITYLVGNKKDLERTIPLEDCESNARKLECAYTEVSVKTCEGIEELKIDALKEILKKDPTLIPDEKQKSNKSNKTGKSNKPNKSKGRKKCVIV